MSAGRYAASLRAGSSELGDIQFSPVSGDYFSVLGVAPMIGRALGEQDMNSSSMAVIGYRLWNERFHADPGVVGAAVVVGAKTYTIVGVAPSGFTGVAAGQLHRSLAAGHVVQTGITLRTLTLSCSA